MQDLERRPSWLPVFSGASHDEIYRMRAAALNPEAAERLARLDRQQEEWKRVTWA
ncbi:lipase secretion chaperone [Massilia cavernae]|uniref:Lipase helper protein n=1 Tax=Massilia cavernae TaxID=2320864 RepID=A0A418XSV4_9BURK|nr:lipase secretion chaperone [Massilia cavernae]RJG15611.1 hypothetical protein D3872_12860 [Massilia cavernae]